MSVIRGFALSMLAVLVALGSAGCDSTQQKEVKIEDYKFVNDVSGLARSPNEEGIVVYDREGVDFAVYDKFIIDPVKVVYNNEDMRNLDQAKLKEIQAYFVESIGKQLKDGGYKVVDSPSAGTLQIQITIVDLSVPSAAYNAVQLIGSPVAATVGSITIEAAFRDASSKQLESVVVARRSGDHMSATPWSNWADVKDSVDAWAEELREALDAARGVTS
ncbi:MAG: DUF3313 domain-containing protein [Kiloniellales bacterium]|nr:DUF3313 domain-containing protein [Kiloniellales bacterium]